MGLLVLLLIFLISRLFSLSSLVPVFTSDEMCSTMARQEGRGRGGRGRKAFFGKPLRKLIYHPRLRQSL